MVSRHKPNLAISGWFQQTGAFSRPWVNHAKCVTRQDLPWTADITPEISQREAMQKICSDCPMITPCAEFALSAAGGFYAGVWIPWKYSEPESEDKKLLRGRAREHLRTIVRRAVALV